MGSPVVSFTGLEVSEESWGRERGFGVRVKVSRRPENEGGCWDGRSPRVLAALRPHWGLHVCLPQAARGPRGLKGEKGEPAVLEPVSHSGH